MPIRHGGRLAMSSSSLSRATLGRTSAGLPDASTPCTAKTFLARSMPTVTMLMDFPFHKTSVLMRGCTSHRGTLMPYCAMARAARDGEVPFIR